MMRLWKGTNCTLFNEKYKVSINATLQLSIKILNKCFYVSKDTKRVSSPVRFIAIWSSCCLKRAFLQNPFVFPRTLVWLPDFSYDARHDTLLSFKWYILPCYYFLLTISGRSFIIYLLRQTNKTLFYPALLITHLI